MDEVGMVRTVHIGTIGITTVRVPSWPGGYRVEERTDGNDAITALLPERYWSQANKLVRIRGGVLVLITYVHFPGKPPLMAEEGVELPPIVIQLPPERMDIAVVPMTR